ncbi:MAG: ABC transporter ATP-binding protein, partial [Mobilicoccus sp.]|nr:ABC transporter ATP-binding protein [Mobilicoccus sp.]
MTTQVHVTALTKRFGDVVALDRADLEVERGHLMAVLGPSGCGKTTLLRLLAGFDHPDSGEIRLAGRLVSGGARGRVVPVHRRGVAVVPQEGALFPHLRVGENVGFGLRRGRESAGRVDEVLDLVGLAGLGSRYPHELSGGQQQRVAVARALAPRPALVLLDEPFSALDAALRTDLRTDIRAALAEDHATGLLVTHDQGEALSVADEVAVMRDGRILQVGAPDEIYRRPADEWVASFVGEAGVVDAEVHAGFASTPFGDLRVAGDAAGRQRILVRPEQVALAGEGVPAAVDRVTYHGHDTLVSMHLEDGTRIYSRMLSGPSRPAAGDVVRGGVDPDVAPPPAGGRPPATPPPAVT